MRFSRLGNTWISISLTLMRSIPGGRNSRNHSFIFVAPTRNLCREQSIFRRNKPIMISFLSFPCPNAACSNLLFRLMAPVPHQGNKDGASFELNFLIFASFNCWYYRVYNLLMINAWEITCSNDVENFDTIFLYTGWASIRPHWFHYYHWTPGEGKLGKIFRIFKQM